MATKEAKLYFAGPKSEYLVAEKREIEADNFYYNLLEELIAGPKNDELAITVPTMTKVLAVEKEGKKIIVDFSQELLTTHWGSSNTQIKTIYSIINTLTQFDEIEQAKIKISGEKISLFGALVFSNPGSYNSDMIR